MKFPRPWRLALILCAFAGLCSAAHAEIVEEIVAVVNGDIVTKSELAAEEEALTAEVYKQFTGAELDKKVEEIGEALLIQIIDNRMLLHKAEAVYDLDLLKKNLTQQYMGYYGIETEAALVEMLERDDMTLDQLHRSLLEQNAPVQYLMTALGHKIGVSAAEVQAYYEENTADFVPPIEVTLREIVLLTGEGKETKEERRAEGERIRQRAIDGESFEELAKETSDAGTNEAGGLLGTFKRGDLSEQLEGPAFTIPVGDVSELLETSYGFHLIKVDARTEDKPLPLEEVSERLRNYLENLRYSTERAIYMEGVREAADWCVKRDYRDKIPSNIEVEVCEGT